MRGPVFLRRRGGAARTARAAAPPPSPLALDTTAGRGPDLGAASELAARFVDDEVLPCVVFGVVDAYGRASLTALRGRRSVVTEDSIFFIASVTKAIVATSVMQYVDEGRLDLHAPLAAYLPRFTGEGRDEVTAWHVLTHTSGLPDTNIDTLRTERPSYARSVEDLLQRSPMWEPGTRYEYNSSAFLLLSETIAALSGIPFTAALQARLMGPLGMADTGFDPRHARRRIVAMNGFGIRNRLVEEVLLRFLVRATLPGGGMFGTVPDLLRLGRALLPASAGAEASPRSPRILSRRAIDEMSRLQTADIPRIAEDGTRSIVPQALGWRKPGPGWPDRPSAITHGGISGSRVWIDPEAGLAYAFLTNLWQAPDEPAAAILEEIYRAVGSSGPSASRG